MTTVVATPGQGPDRPQEVSYTDTKVIGNGSFGVVYQAKLCETNEFVAIKKVLQDKRFKVSRCTNNYGIFADILFMLIDARTNIVRLLNYYIILTGINANVISSK